MFLSMFQSILLNRLGLVTVTLHSGARWDDDEGELFINVAPDEYDETKEVKLETIECDDVFDVVGEVSVEPYPAERDTRSPVVAIATF